MRALNYRAARKTPNVDAACKAARVGVVLNLTEKSFIIAIGDCGALVFAFASK